MLKKFLQTAVQNIVDPDREHRRTELRAFVDRGLHAAKEKFQLSRDIPLAKYPATDIEAVQREVIMSILARAKSPGLLSPGERKTLDWLFRSLEAPEAVRRDCLIEFIALPFEKRFYGALSKERLDAKDLDALSEIAATVGTDAKTFIAWRFGQFALNWVVMQLLAQLRSEWLSFDRVGELRGDAERLGVYWSQALAAVGDDAVSFTERVLADAKYDGVITWEEESVLVRLLDEFQLPAMTRMHVRQTVDTVKRHHSLRLGQLPSVPSPPGIAFRAGEIVHYVGRATLRTTKQRPSGPELKDRYGTLVLTDNRAMFVGDAGAKVFILRQIVQYATNRGWMQLTMSQQSPYVLIAHDEPIECGLIFESALRMVNQTLVREATTHNPRHIPRDVRQRVFQRYGGRCADCGAKDYLEFDHIVPVAKGGGNSDQNVQLLCRGCNSKKSDRI